MTLIRETFGVVNSRTQIKSKYSVMGLTQSNLIVPAGVSREFTVSDFRL